MYLGWYTRNGIFADLRVLHVLDRPRRIQMFGESVDCDGIISKCIQA